MARRKRGLARQAFALQNEWRNDHGAGSLAWTPGMYLTAKAACWVIIRRGELRHDPAWYRGLRRLLGNVELAENIGWGQDVPPEIIRGWDESEVHDRIMRKRSLKRGAIATVYSRRLGRRVWCAHYAGSR